MMLLDQIVSNGISATQTNNHLIQSKKNVIVYISAMRCIRCNQCTSRLVDAYKTKGDHVEIVFISLDQTIGEYKEHYRQMPWLSVTYDPSFRYRFFDTCKVDIIPSVLVFDAASNLVSRNDFAAVEKFLTHP
jgi:hypothetical protein